LCTTTMDTIGHAVYHLVDEKWLSSSMRPYVLEYVWVCLKQRGLESIDTQQKCRAITLAWKTLKAFPKLAHISRETVM